MQDTILHLAQLAEQSHRQGKIEQYIDHLDQLLQVKREVYGEGSSEAQSIQDTLCTLLNHQGILYLQRSDVQTAHNYLKRAEHNSSTDLQKVSVYNNLACLYRRTGKLRIALNYLQQALTIELRLPQTTNLSDTYLNLCAVYSQLERHDDALQHIYLSIIMLQHELLMKTLSTLDLRRPMHIRETDSRAESTSQDSSRQLLTIAKNQGNRLQDRVAVLVVAYHNLGVEMEHLKKVNETISLSQIPEAKKIYQSALSLAEQSLNKNHQMLGVLRSLNKEHKENVINEQKLPAVSKPELKPLAKFAAPRSTISVMTRRTRNKLYVPVMNLSPPTHQSSTTDSRSSPFQQTQQVVRLKSMSVNSPLEFQQQMSLRNQSINEESQMDLST